MQFPIPIRTGLEINLEQRDRKTVESDRDISTKDAYSNLKLLLSILESTGIFRMKGHLVQQAAGWEMTRGDARWSRALTNVRNPVLMAEDGYLIGARLYAYVSAPR